MAHLFHLAQTAHLSAKTEHGPRLEYPCASLPSPFHCYMDSAPPASRLCNMAPGSSVRQRCQFRVGKKTCQRQELPLTEQLFGVGPSGSESALLSSIFCRALTELSKNQLCKKMDSLNQLKAIDQLVGLSRQTSSQLGAKYGVGNLPFLPNLEAC